MKTPLLFAVMLAAACTDPLSDQPCDDAADPDASVDADPDAPIRPGHFAATAHLYVDGNVATLVAEVSCPPGYPDGPQGAIVAFYPHPRTTLATTDWSCQTRVAVAVVRDLPCGTNVAAQLYIWDPTDATPMIVNPQERDQRTAPCLPPGPVAS